MAELPTPTESSPFSNSLDDQAPTIDRFEALPNCQDMMDMYLFGIPFENQDGSSAKPALINHYINVALSRFEHVFSQPVLPRKFVEPHDYKIQDYSKFGYIKLFHTPVISVNQVQLQFIKNETLIDLPLEWIRLTQNTGQIQIVPTTAAISQFVISGSGDLPHIFGAKSYFPHLIYVNYTAGFETNKIPAVVVHWVSLQAAIQMLAIAGDAIYGPGLGNVSISIGGLSQSLGTTKGQKGAFAGRIEMYQQELMELTKEIRRFYKSVSIVTV